MNNKVKILLLGVILLVALFNRQLIGEYLGFGQAEPPDDSIATPVAMESPEEEDYESGNYPVNDTLYRWNEQLLNWAPVEETQDYQIGPVNNSKTGRPATGPVEVSWPELTDIRYQLYYFKKVEMEIFAPVFPKAIQALDGQEVLIEGFVLPLDEETLSLSYNPYASCFFCGKASPASVMNMYLKDDSKRYRMDEFKKFRGTLHLNSDDPDEFYYILRDASEE